jgi:hypothetical protein
MNGARFKYTPPQVTHHFNALIAERWLVKAL